MEIELPDGTVLDAPDGADASQIAKNYLAKKSPAVRPAQSNWSLPQAMGRVGMQAVKGVNSALVNTLAIPADAGIAVRNLLTGSKYPAASELYGQFANKQVGEPQTDAESLANTAGNIAGSIAIPMPKAPPAGVQSALAQTLARARNSNYVIPPAASRPTLLNRALESVLGKKDIAADATQRNVKQLSANVANELAVPAGTEINPATLHAVISDSGDAYGNIAKLSPEYASKIEEIKSLRNVASKWFKQSATNYSVDAEEKATTAWEQAKTLDDELGKSLTSSSYATRSASSGVDSNLFSDYQDARVRIAKAYDVMKALVKSKGELKASSFAKSFKADKPLTGELATAGRTGEAFPESFSTPEGSPIGRFDQWLLGSGVGASELLRNPKYIGLAETMALARAGGRPIA